MEERINLRFCTFYISTDVSRLLQKIFTNGLFIVKKDENKTERFISDLVKYAGDTYRLNLSNLSDEEYKEYSKYFDTIIEPLYVFNNKIVIFEDDFNVIFIG